MGSGEVSGLLGVRIEGVGVCAAGGRRMVEERGEGRGGGEDGG
jgi:hypothetical protein